MITKWKSDFEKHDLQRSELQRMTAVKIVGPSPWCGIVARHEALIISFSDLELDLSWYENVTVCLSDTDPVRNVLNRIRAKVGDMNLYIMGGLFTIELEIRMID